MRRTTVARGLSIVLALGALALSGCSSAPDDSTVSTLSAPSGSTGAARFDDGYLVAGDGGKVVDLYVDALCPYCKLFEESSGPSIFADVEAGRTTLRVHPLSFLDRISEGTEYSTRAAAALTEVAVTDPEHLVDYLKALFAHQPEENTPGHTDAQLSRLATDAGTSLGNPEARDQYKQWVRDHTTKAVNGPLVDAKDLAAVKVVPTVLVNGHHFPGNSNQTAEFAEFYAAH